MRDNIKFRFVDKDNKTGIVSLHISTVNDIEWEDSWQGELPYTRLGIDQYTGLKDKNGKEIYEGDIVEYERLTPWEDEITRDEVIYSEGRFYPMGGYCIIDNGNIDDNTIDNIELEFEIVGNIHEESKV